MAIRTLSNNSNNQAALRSSLLSYEPYIIAHLVKFERPANVSQISGVNHKYATDYTYITDAQYNIAFNDGDTNSQGAPLGSQNYMANKLVNLGAISETTVAKATGLSLTLDAASLGATATVSATFTTTKITTDTDMPSQGFKEGDKILLSSSGNANDGAYVRIDSFESGGKVIAFIQISSISANSSAETFNITLASDELTALLTNKDVVGYTNYINREVTIYKAHIHPETRAIIGEPFIYFKGIVSNSSLEEKLTSSKVTWSLTSHWGDFVRVQGRLTDDSSHRALGSDGSPDPDVLVRPEYATDLGFIHANTAFNQVIKYIGKKTEFYEGKDSSVTGMGTGPILEREVDVDKQVDVNINIAGKLLPVVYGVRKIKPFPIFVDVHKDLDRQDEVYRIDAICEGRIAGILDILVENNSTICMDKVDFDTRASGDAAVDVVCAGRADRGDTLAHYSATGAELLLADDSSSRITQEADEIVHSESTNEAAFNTTDTGAVDANGSGIASGVLHTGTHTMLAPMDASLTFYLGKADQKADPVFVKLASQNDFKLQADYFQGSTSQYWGPAHRLLDTAYVTGKYRFSEGETTMPEYSYIVRGRNPNCYNYDQSYIEDASQTSDAISSFVIYENVTFHKTSDDSQLGSGTTRIIDKWYSIDADGALDYRFKWGTPPTLGSTTAFYMKDSDGNKWHMQTWDHVADAEKAVGGNLYAAVASTEAGTAYGQKITLTSPSAALEFALGDTRTVVGLHQSGSPRLLASNFADYTFSASTNIVDNITRYSTLQNITRLYAKNAIQLHATASGTNDAYNGHKITVTDYSGDSPYKQERLIVDYDGTTKVAILDSSFDYTNMPVSGTTKYVIGSLDDKRVTINPAIQLLDYLTNKRYGKGLEEKDLDIESFLKAARDCDTRSEVKIVVTGDTIPVGEVWQYPKNATNSTRKWLGVVKSVASYTIGGTVYREVTFKDNIGKFGLKWNTWRYYSTNDLYWHKGKVYGGTNSTVTTAPTSGNLTAVDIGKFADSAERSVDISMSAANGNPLVKAISTVTGKFTASGYSLYDSDDVKYWKYLGWDSPDQRNVTRHQMNQVVNTTTPLFDNINKMLSQFNGILRYSGGKYSLEIKGSHPGSITMGNLVTGAQYTITSLGNKSQADWNTLAGTGGVVYSPGDNFQAQSNGGSDTALVSGLDISENITEEDIIGTIKVSDKGLKGSKNEVSASIIDPQNKFEGRSISFFNSIYLREDKGIKKKGNYSLPGITNYHNARFNIKQYLDESRYGITIQFTMAPRGLLLTAGSIIELTYPRFGYTNKLFRINNLSFKKDGLVSVVADEHNDDAYVVTGASTGVGLVENPEDGTVPRGFVIPNRPIQLVATQNRKGVVGLNWSNTPRWNAATHTTEIWRSPVNNFAAEVVISTNSFVVGRTYRITDLGNSTQANWNTAAGTSSFTYKVGDEIVAAAQLGGSTTGKVSATVMTGTSSGASFDDTVETTDINRNMYYWMRYQVSTDRLNLAGSAKKLIASLYYPNTTDSGFGNGEGITGISSATATPRSVTIIPGATQQFIYNEAGDGIESGYPATSVLTTTVSGNSPTGTISYVWSKTPKGGSKTAINGQVSSSLTYTPTSAFADMPEIIHCDITDTVGSETFTASDTMTMFAGQIVANGQTVQASNGTHVFPANKDGDIADIAQFSLTFPRVMKGTTALSYNATGGEGTYSYGGFANITPANSVVPINTGGTITIHGSTGSFLTGNTVNTATFDVPIIDNGNSASLGSFRVQLTKAKTGETGGIGNRAGGVFTFEESTTSGITDATVTTWVGAVLQAGTATTAVATAVIAASEDGFIRPNDKITVTDNSADKAGTRIYTGSPTNSASSATSWSSLVVETFDGSVIVDGTLSANTLTANFTRSNVLNVGSALNLANNGQFYTGSKTTFSDTDSGIFMGWDSNAHKLNIGTATEFVKFDGTSLNIKSTDGGFDLRSSSNTNNSRVEITATGVKVFDGATLRVQLGDLS